jgi:RNA polymerase sigma-70 factor (ECF subfamily)
MAGAAAVAAGLRTPTFEDIVAAAVKGAPAEVDRLFHLVRPAVVRYCRARIGGYSGHGDADDVAQEVCVGLFAALPHYDDKVSGFLPFVYGIASHKVIDYFRKCGRDHSDVTLALPEGVDPAPGPEAIAVLRDGTAQAAVLLRGLSERQRDILALRLVVGLTSAETAAAIGMTPSAVRVTQRRALARLRAAAVAQEPELVTTSG